MGTDTYTKNTSLSTATPPAQDKEEIQHLIEAARNNRLHQLPRELLYMIVDYLQRPTDIINLSGALLGPFDGDMLNNLESVSLRLNLMSTSIDRLSNRL